MTDISRRIQESGQALLRHWRHPIGPALGLADTNLLGDDSPVSELLDMGAGIDFFVAYGGGRGICGIATRVQWRGMFTTITWRNRSTTSELSKACNAYLSQDRRIRPDWCVHLYEEQSTHHLHGFVAAHADDLARYYLNGHPASHRSNHEDETPFAAFDAADLRRAGIEVVDWWATDSHPNQLSLWGDVA